MAFDPRPDYIRGNPASPVAICTLSSRELMQRLSTDSVLQRVAIIGGLETENLGLERMLRTLLRQPSIRALILCGEQNPRWRPGDAVRAVFQHGLGPGGEIPGFNTRRARLPSLRSDELSVVRERVALHDLLGETDVDLILGVADGYPLDPPERVRAETATPSSESTIAVPTAPPQVKALDPAGFFVILVDREDNQLIVEHYGNDRDLRHRLAGESADSLSAAIVEWGLLSRLDHAVYLGRELARAEAALRLGLTYVQDEGLTGR